MQFRNNYGKLLSIIRCLETVKNSPHLDANLKQMVSIINIAALCFLSWFYLSLTPVLFYLKSPFQVTQLIHGCLTATENKVLALMPGKV